MVAQEIGDPWLQPFRGEARAAGDDEMAALRFRSDEAGRIRDHAEGVPYLLCVEMAGMRECGFSTSPLE